MRTRAGTALLIVTGLLGVDVRAAAEPLPAAGSRVNAIEAMKAPIKELGAFLSNATFKLRQGVSGVGGQGGEFSIRNCCSINVDRMRAALDVLGRERSDLQREYERTRHAEGVAKLDALSDSLKTFEEGHRLLQIAKRSDQAMAVLDGLLKNLHAIEAAHAELAACCSPAER